MEDKYGTVLFPGDWVAFVEQNYCHQARVIGSTTPNNLICAYEAHNMVGGILPPENSPGYPKLRKSVVKLANVPTPVTATPGTRRGWIYLDNDSTGHKIFVGDYVTFAETPSRMGKGTVTKITPNVREVIIVTIMSTTGDVKRREAHAVGLVDSLDMDEGNLV